MAPIYGFESKQTRDKLNSFARTLSAPFTDTNTLVPFGEQQTRIFKATVKTKITAAIGGKAGFDYKVGTGEVYILRREGLMLKFWFHDGTNIKLDRTVFNACPVIYDVDENSILTIAQDRNGDLWVEKVCEVGSFSSSSSCSSPSSTISSRSSSVSSSKSSSIESSFSSSSSSSIFCECIPGLAKFLNPLKTSTSESYRPEVKGKNSSSEIISNCKIPTRMNRFSASRE